MTADNIGNSNKTRGIVKWFSALKGYGFIDSNEYPKGVFVHHTDIQATGYRTLTEGQTVEYELVQSSKGPKAEKVQVIS